VTQSAHGGGDFVEASGIAIDLDGQAWVVGTSLDADNDPSLMLLKLDAQGIVADGFPVVHSGAVRGRSQDRGIAIAIDPAGSVWATGQAAVGPARHYVLWKFGSAGDLAPGFPVTRNEDGGAESWHAGQALAFGPDGDAGGYYHDGGEGIVVDPADNAWVAGWSYNASRNTDAVLWKLDPWGRDVPGFPIVRDGDGDGSDGQDFAQAVALGADASVWVAGSGPNGRGGVDLVVWQFE